ncbi:MAG: hypothetical protein RRY20_06420, partial [Bilophila sp.]
MTPPRTPPTETPAATPPSKGKLFRITGALVAGLVLLGLIALAAGLLFLRSERGERWISASLVETLQNAGITAELGALRGPLPERLTVRGLKLSDAHGVWLEIPAATLELRLETLVRGQLTIRELTVTDPVLWRLPTLPASVPTPERPSLLQSTQLEALSAQLATVLEHVTLEALRIETFRLGAAVLEHFQTENALLT